MSQSAGIGSGAPGGPTGNPTVGGAGNQSSTDRQERIEVFKLAAELADRVSQRRQAHNNFYLSVNIAVIGAVAYLSGVSDKRMASVAVSISGILICASWWRGIGSYKRLNEAKYKVIHELERQMVVTIFTPEWDELHKKGGQKHTQFNQVETVVPIAFGGLHLVNLLMQARWHEFLLFCKDIITR